MTKKDYFHTELYDLMVYLAYSGVSYAPTTGEYSATQLAEYVADEYNHPEWLDDDSHVIWDAAADAADHMMTSRRSAQ